MAYTNVRKCIGELEKNAEFFSYLHKHYRRIQVKGFPFYIVYKIESRLVFILAILHQSRNPAELLKRLK